MYMTQEVHDRAGMGTHTIDVLSNSLSSRKFNVAATLGPAGIYLFFNTLTAHFPGIPLRGLPPTRLQLIFSSEGKGLLDLDRNQRGGQTAGALNGEEELEEVAL